MTLLEVIRRIESVAGVQPSVNTIVRDNITLLDSHPAVRYGAFAWVQGQHQESIGTDWRTYRFSFFYLDRLVGDRSNAIEAQSVGMDTIGNVLRVLADDFDIAEWSIDTIAGHADECAGVVADVTLRALRGGCGYEYPESTDGDFNNDFNNDFLIFKKKRVEVLQ